ncbi:MAG: hypothetical protein EOO61_22970 [Hymenobacter sp.]|nr:MAG: hypothetical protein EOO61_22970 [Hymenobacter sp.]
MSTPVLYIELKSRFSNDGPAWVGKGKFTRTRRTIYFNGLALRKAQGANSNYIEVQTGDSYWVSGVKKNGTDRHLAGSGRVFVDESVVVDYLRFRGLEKLPTSNYEIVCLGNIPVRQQLHDIENAAI